MEETRNDVEIEINNEEDFMETVEEKSRFSKCKSFVKRHAKKIGTAGLFLAVGCIGYALEIAILAKAVSKLNLD